MADIAGTYAGANPLVFSAGIATKDIFASSSIPPGSIVINPDPPSISNVQPTPGTQLATRTTPITFRVTDSAPGLRLVVVTLQYVGDSVATVVHDGTKFLSVFAGGASSRAGISGGYDFLLLPLGGWRGPILNLQVYAVDTHGNLTGGLP